MVVTIGLLSRGTESRTLTLGESSVARVGVVGLALATTCEAVGEVMEDGSMIGTMCDAMIKNVLEMRSVAKVVSSEMSKVATGSAKEDLVLLGQRPCW